jgi:hypothetical protein
MPPSRRRGEEEGHDGRSAADMGSAAFNAGGRIAVPQFFMPPATALTVELFFAPACNTTGGSATQSLFRLLTESTVFSPRILIERGDVNAYLALNSDTSNSSYFAVLRYVRVESHILYTRFASAQARAFEPGSRPTRLHGFGTWSGLTSEELSRQLRSPPSSDAPRSREDEDGGGGVDGDAWMAHAWHHIALTFNGTASILYVDGEQRAAWYERELKQVLPHAPQDPTQRSPTSRSDPIPAISQAFLTPPHAALLLPHPTQRSHTRKPAK